MPLSIPGFDSQYKTPYFAVELSYAAGPIEGGGQLNVLLCGVAGTGGSGTSGNPLGLNSEIRQVYQQSDVDSAVQSGTQLSRMGRSAFAAVPRGANIFIAGIPEPAGGAASTWTATISGSWSTTGQLTLSIGGQTVTITVNASDTPSQVATNLASAMAGLPDLSFSGAAVAAVLTGTSLDVGAQANQWVVTTDASLAPAGFVCTLAGSSTLHNNENGVSQVFSGASLGSGVESVTTILTKLTTRRYARIAAGQIDAVNAALWRAFIRQQEAPLVQKFQMIVFGQNGTSASAIALAQTTLNDPNCQVIAQRYSETHPAEMAAGCAALRAAVEQDDPVPDYDGMGSGPTNHGDWSAWISPNRFRADQWLDSEANTLLNSGVTPIQTMGGAAKCTRAITTYCQLNGSPDFRCLDIGDAVFPAYAAVDITNLYWSQFRAKNKYVRDNPLPQEPEPPSGVAYPDLWKSTLQKRLEDYFANGWLIHTWSPGDVPFYPIVSQFNSQAERIESSVNLVVQRVQHQLGQQIIQTSL